uniref:Uncharacterized protein n=1 Tax=Hyaloperonospora arabidopsidis (strain Emoy2) TaxID=559515 RepID=M4B5B2_HYAAE
MQSDPLPEAVYVTIFIEGLRTGVARTEVFRVHPCTFEGAVRIALIAERNFKSARLSWNGYNPSSARANYTSTSAVNRPEPMDLSYAEAEGEVDLQVAEQKRVTAPGYEATLYPEPEVLHGAGKCRHSVGARRPTKEEQAPRVSYLLVWSVDTSLACWSLRRKLKALKSPGRF